MITRKVYVLIIFLLTLSFIFQGSTAGAEVSKQYKRSVEKYAVPDVTLVNQDGKKVNLGELLNAKDTVLLDFVFTTCTTICPLLSLGFLDFQKKLGYESEKVQLISISIDPEHDTPKIMKSYFKRYDAQPGWDFLTGSRGDIDKVLKAFNAYTPNKMTHSPLILLKSRSDTEWVRIYGLIGTRDLLREYQNVLR